MSSSLAYPSPPPPNDYPPPASSAMAAPVLSSNNPFRRVASPPALSPLAISPSLQPSYSFDPPNHDQNTAPANGNWKRMTTNPFLDNYQPPPQPVSRGRTSPAETSPFDLQPRVQRQPTDGMRSAAEQLNGLVLNDRPQRMPVPESALKPRPLQQNIPPPPPQHQIVPPPPYNPPGLTHRTRNSEDAKRLRREIMDGNPASTAVLSHSPERKENRRPVVRRNSDTSILDFKEEKSKTRDDRSRRPKRSNRQVDIIDKLDVTGVFGVGMFHHDGPFDACNPHRNRKGHRAAPMQAFAEGSLNNAIGGSGPVNRNIDLDRIHGRGAEGFDDYNSTAHPTQRSTSRKPRTGSGSGSRGPQSRQDYMSDYRQNKDTMQFDDPKGANLLHGEETVGLGTSTFLEGAPAPRSVVQRRESENEQPQPSGGLTRKKSLAHKLGMVRQKNDPDRSAIVSSPEGRRYAEPARTASPHPPPQQVQSAGGPSRMNETNPFFSDLPHDNKAPSTIKIVDDSERVQRLRTNSSPPRGILRRTGNDNITSENDSKSSNGGSGLLSRMKSLKSNRRPERQAGPA